HANKSDNPSSHRRRLHPLRPRPPRRKAQRHHRHTRRRPEDLSHHPTHRRPRQCRPYRLPRRAPQHPGSPSSRRVAGVEHPAPQHRTHLRRNKSLQNPPPHRHHSRRSRSPPPRRPRLRRLRRSAKQTSRYPEPSGSDLLAQVKKGLVARGFSLGSPLGCAVLNSTLNQQRNSHQHRRQTPTKQPGHPRHQPHLGKRHIRLRQLMGHHHMRRGIAHNCKYRQHNHHAPEHSHTSSLLAGHLRARRHLDRLPLRRRHRNVIEGRIRIGNSQPRLRLDINVAQHDVLHRSLRQSHNHARRLRSRRLQILNNNVVKQRSQPCNRSRRDLALRKHLRVVLAHQDCRLHIRHRQVPEDDVRNIRSTIAVRLDAHTVVRIL